MTEQVHFIFLIRANRYLLLLSDLSRGALSLGNL